MSEEKSLARSRTSLKNDLLNAVAMYGRAEVALAINEDLTLFRSIHADVIKWWKEVESLLDKLDANVV